MNWDWGVAAFVLIVLHLLWHMWVIVRADILRRMQP